MIPARPYSSVAAFSTFVGHFATHRLHPVQRMRSRFPPSDPGGAIAAAPEGAVLFHCAVGKDRTGVLAMLLMLLAGCDRWDCAANYVQTRHNLMRYDWYEYVWNNGPDDPHYAFNDSPANAVEHALAFVEARGGVVPYLRECGVSYEEIEAVRARLLN